MATLPPEREGDPQPTEEQRVALERFCAPPQFCRYCGHVGLTPHWLGQLVAKDMGTWSLAGVQNKTVASLVAWPYVSCDKCGHVSKGK